MQYVRRVALIYDARSAYDVKVMTGVASYVQQSMKWSVYLEEDALKDQRLPNLRSWKGDGIIADFDHPKVAAAVVQAKLPTVGFGSAEPCGSGSSRGPAAQSVSDSRHPETSGSGAEQSDPAGSVEVSANLCSVGSQTAGAVGVSAPYPRPGDWDGLPSGACPYCRTSFPRSLMQGYLLEAAFAR